MAARPRTQRLRGDNMTATATRPTARAPSRRPAVAHEPRSTDPEPTEPALTPLDVAHDFIRRYVALADVQLDAVTLWCAHTWAFDAAETTPYLAVQSIEPGSGKSRLGEVVEQIVAAPWFTGRTTGPALVRKVAQDKPTLILDETDCLFSGIANSQQMLR